MIIIYNKSDMIFWRDFDKRKSCINCSIFFSILRTQDKQENALKN